MVRILENPRINDIAQQERQRIVEIVIEKAIEEKKYEVINYLDRKGFVQAGTDANGLLQRVVEEFTQELKTMNAGIFNLIIIDPVDKNPQELKTMNELPIIDKDKIRELSTKPQDLGRLPTQQKQPINTKK